MNFTDEENLFEPENLIEREIPLNLSKKNAEPKPLVLPEMPINPPIQEKNVESIPDPVTVAGFRESVLNKPVFDYER